MVRIARSVRPDTARLAIPLRVGWLPAGMAMFGGSVEGGPPTSWTMQVHLGTPAGDKRGTPAGDKNDTRACTIVVGTATPAPSGGEALTVGGRSARFVTRTVANGQPVSVGYLVVELGDGLLLTGISTVAQPAAPVTAERAARPTATVSREDLVRIAESAQIGPLPDLSWLGPR